MYNDVTGKSRVSNISTKLSFNFQNTFNEGFCFVLVLTIKRQQQMHSYPFVLFNFILLPFLQINLHVLILSSVG